MVARPQVWPIEKPPAAICWKVKPDTRAGARRATMVPSPSWPRSLFPQQYASPALVSAQVCAVPASILVNLSPVKT